MGWLSHIIIREIDEHLIASSDDEKEQELNDIMSELADKIDAIQTGANDEG